MRAKASFAGKVWLSGLVVLTALALRVSAGEGQTGALGGLSATAPQSMPIVGVQKASPEPPPAASVSTAEVLKMANAGVSQEVIRSFIENARSASAPSPSDVIALKQHGLADEVTMALIKRSAETRAANAEAVSRFIGQLRGQNSGPAGRLDPESYEYFQHYYLFPRTLSSVYDRLYFGTPPSYRPWPPYGYGY
jgi:hypothetical protein